MHAAIQANPNRSPEFEVACTMYVTRNYGAAE